MIPGPVPTGPFLGGDFMILSSDSKLLYHFLTLCQGNWHRTAYIKCDSCPASEKCQHKDALLVIDRKGTPVILPVPDAVILFSERPDAGECLFSMTKTQFTSLYKSYLSTLTHTEEQCPFRNLSRSITDLLYDW